MHALGQTNSFKGGIVCLPQVVEPLKEPMGILSQCYYIISFSFWQAIILIDFWSIAPFFRIGSFPLLWNMVSPCPSSLPHMIDQLLKLTEVGAVGRVGKGFMELQVDSWLLFTQAKVKQLPAQYTVWWFPKAGPQTRARLNIRFSFVHGRDCSLSQKGLPFF